MPNRKITELTALTDPDANDLLAIVDDPSGSPVTKQISATKLVKSLNNQAATIVVAANNSLHKERADYVCDGVDDQVQIQAALDSMTVGGLLYLEAGLYNISNSIVMPAVSSIAIEGASVGYSNTGTYLHLDNGSNCNMFELNHATHVYFTKFSNLKISGNKTQNSTSHMFNITKNVSDISFENLFIVDAADDGIHFQPTDDCWNCWVTQCLIEACGGSGIFMDSVKFVWISKCYVYENQNGLWISSSYNMFLSDNYIIKTFNHGIVLSSVTYSLLNGTSVAGIDHNSTNVYDGIHVINNCAAVLIQGNIVKTENKGRAGLYIEDGCTRIGVDGNDLKDAWGSCKKVVDESTASTVEIRNNYGYITKKSGSSTGTGAQQTIAHGLATTPAKVILWNIENGANPYQGSAASGTNIYITAGSAIDYGWEAEVL